MSQQHPQPSQPPPAGAGGVAPAVERACPNCGREWGDGQACQFCRQVSGFPQGIPLASSGKRFGAYLLEGVLAVVTLGLGYLVWILIVWKDGKTPGKQLLNMKVAKLATARKATWGTMALRDFVLKGLLFGTLAAITFGLGLILLLWLLWDKNNQQLWDKMIGTVVVDDPTNRLG